MKDKPDNNEMMKSIILEIRYVKMFMKNVGGKEDTLHVLNRLRT
jgi:hypothetical protein